MAKIVNGVNVDDLMNTLEEIKKDPEIAGFKFRAKSKWIDGTHNRAAVKGFYGAFWAYRRTCPWDTGRSGCSSRSMPI